MFIITKLTLDSSGRVVEKEGYEYIGPLSLSCGASDQQNQIFDQQQQFYSFLTQSAQKEFTQGMAVFKDIFKAMSPIVNAGPNQQGFSQSELDYRNRYAEQTTAQAYKMASQAARQQEAAIGGNQFIPNGGVDRINAEIAAGGAAQLQTELNQIQQENYATGRQNFFAAEGALSGATGVFNPVTGASGVANQGGSDASQTANEITQANNSWVQAVTGALGGVAGGIATGGMKNLGAGVGFFGQDASAPKG